MDDIINNVGVRPNRGFPVVVYFDINEILLSSFVFGSFFGFFSPLLLLLLILANQTEQIRTFFLSKRGAVGRDNLAKKTPYRSNSPS